MLYIGVSKPDMFFKRRCGLLSGYFKDDVLDVEVLQMNANVSVAARAARNIDYNLILQSVVTANLRGLPLKVAGILIEQPNHAVVVHPIKSLLISKARRSRLARSLPGRYSRPLDGSAL